MAPKTHLKKQGHGPLSQSFPFPLLAVTCGVLLLASNAIPHSHAAANSPPSSSNDFRSWIKTLPPHSAPIAGAYLIEYNVPSLQEGARSGKESAETSADQEKTHASFLKFSENAKITVQVRRRYRNLWSGLAIQAQSDVVSKLKSAPGVQAIYPILRVPLALVTPSKPSTNAKDQIMEAAHNLTQVTLARTKFGVSGKGVKVGIIDTYVY
jgi:hypothetical protein